MSEGKTYILNSDVCDTTKMSEDLFEQYEKVIINSDLVIVNERSKAILNKYLVKLNVDAVVNAEEDVDLCVINGKYEIKESEPRLKDTVLVVNGALTIDKNTEGILKKYIKIIVNGKAKYPQSVAPYVAKMTVNGAVECYPDDCVLLKETEILDKYFYLRAKKDAKYYARNEIVIADSNIDVKLLKDKNIKFITKKATILENKVSEAIDMFDENAEILIIPSECGFINGDVTLDEFILKKYGSKLYVNGNLNLNSCSTELIKNIDYLKVCGRVSLLKNQEEEFLKIDAEYEDISIVKGKEIRNKSSVTIDEKMLDLIEDGVSIRNCAMISIDSNLSSEKILKSLQFENCAKIICTEDQKSAIELVSTNIGKIEYEEDKEDTDEMDSITKYNKNTNVINADNYTL